MALGVRPEALHSQGKGSGQSHTDCIRSDSTFFVKNFWPDNSGFSFCAALSLMAGAPRGAPNKIISVQHGVV